MKRVFVLFAILLAASTCLAADFSANLKLQTGDASLDVSLSNINHRTATPIGAVEVRREITQQFVVPEKEIQFLSKKGYCLAEIYYLALLSKKSGKPIGDAAALHSKGIGWGVLAKRMGVKPNELNKMIVKEKKAEKAAEKGKEIKTEKTTTVKVEEKTVVKEKTQTKEKTQIKVTPKMEGKPAHRSFSEGGGTGKGKGR